jgi:hypothetical protein
MSLQKELFKRKGGLDGGVGDSGGSGNSYLHRTVSLQEVEVLEEIDDEEEENNSLESLLTT